MKSALPRYAAWSIRAACWNPDREYLLGDLEEEFQNVARERGERAAQHWLRGEILPGFLM